MRKNGYKARSIKIPEWMNSAVTDLAVKHKRSVNAEIEYLVESGLESMGLVVSVEATRGVQEPIPRGDRVTA